MLPGRLTILGLQFMALLAAAPLIHGAQQSNEPPATASVLRIDGLGKGTTPLGGTWQFHTGDDPAWANPSLDDRGWESLTADTTWGSQGHEAYIGYAWYRRHLELHLAPGASPEVAIFISPVEDAYEVFWNGRFIGRYGKLPPHPVWYYRPSPQTFGLGPAQSGVLAVRIWKAPLETFDPATLGGFTAPPLIGSPQSIADTKTSSDYAWLHSHQVAFALDSLYTLVGLIGWLLWLRDRSQRLLFWMFAFAGSSAIFECLVPLGFPLSADQAIGAAQPLLSIISVSTWFVLLILLDLEQNLRFVRVMRTLAAVSLAAGCLNGLELVLLPLVSSRVQPALESIDAALTAIQLFLDTVPVFLVLYGVLRRRRLNVDRWVVAACAFLADGIPVLRIAFAQGARFTHWTISAKISAPLFILHGNPINAQNIAQTLLLLALVFAAWRFTAEENRRRAAIDQELTNAREVQQVLIPEAVPPIPGFALTSVYRPAQEVGGDFFQIIPLHAQMESPPATLVVLGDVSGKGLKAAMAVALIVGAVRMAAETTSSPALILAALNRRLCGRMAGGFATAVALRIEAEGHCAIASAGHPPPFLNGEELSLSGSLPLGLAPATAYAETLLCLRPSDQLALYTDGLLEARSPAGELYGFGRLRDLFSAAPTAEQATLAAVAFGQEDDITVLTLTRLAEQKPVAELVPTRTLSSHA